MVVSFRRFLPVLTGLALLALPVPGEAATIATPPITVTSLGHTQGGPPYYVDAVSFNVTGYTIGSFTGGGAFTASIATGDVVTMRIEAPAGKKFAVHVPPGGSALLSFNTYWMAAGGQGLPEEPNTVTFEGLAGPAPVQSYSHVDFTENRTVIEYWKQFTASASFEFRAVAVSMTAAWPQPTQSRNYAAVQSHQQNSFVAAAVVDPTTTIMEIVDENVPTATRSTSWGRLHTLYR